MASLLARSRCFGVRAQAQQRPAARVLVVRAQAQKPVAEQLQALAKPALLTAAANIIMAMPASAEAGKIFDFNLTLPVMAGQFLALMFFLDKFWFGPVGKVLDERDELIRSRLAAVKGDTADLEKYTVEAEEILKAARAEVSALIANKKNAKTAELDKIYAAAKAKVTTETDSAIAGLEKESQTMLKSLDGQVEKISAEVLRRVLPEGVKI
jgi:F-type H+-transporting ATPase subunit b